MTETNSSVRRHSVVLDEEACKGCTVCVTTCPAEAIRVRDGKARILEERCIDCGECIRRCPHHAKKARADDLSILLDAGHSGKFDYLIALPAPSLYGQFPERYSIASIHAAIKHLGFDTVFPVAAATPAIAAETRALLDRNRHPDLPRPLISSSCPTIIKFIQIRFPILLDHIVPVIAPMELAARLARMRSLDAVRLKSGKADPKIGVFFISPCAGKITEAAAPIGGEKSSIDGVLSMKDIHLPILAALAKIETTAGEPESTAEEIAWGHAGGEAEATVAASGCTWLAVDGMEQCTRILESVEEEKLADVDFLELMACTGGCVGGPLIVVNPALARHTIQQREKKLRQTVETVPAPDGITPIVCENCLRTGQIPARPALLLDGDYRKAMAMMDSMEQICEGLPGLDCGCCGAPNCHALAEDIVRGNASRTDCVIILKEQYRILLEGGKARPT